MKPISSLALEKGLEGVVAKRKDSEYEEGLRTGSWLKIKKLKTCDCVIFGYTRGTAVRAKTFGALLLGVYDKMGKPVYVGQGWHRLHATNDWDFN